MKKYLFVLILSLNSVFMSGALQASDEDSLVKKVALTSLKVVIGAVVFYYAFEAFHEAFVWEVAGKSAREEAKEKDVLFRYARLKWGNEYKYNEFKHKHFYSLYTKYGVDFDDVLDKVDSGDIFLPKNIDAFERKCRRFIKDQNRDDFFKLESLCIERRRGFPMTASEYIKKKVPDVKLKRDIADKYWDRNDICPIM